MQTSHLRNQGRVLASVSKGLSLVSHQPIHSTGSYSGGPDLNASFRLGCPRFPRLAPYFSCVY
jgi:hypothetical protein